MNEKGVDLDGALDWLAKYHGQVLSNFKVHYLIAVIPQSIPKLATPKKSKRLAHWISFPVARDTEILADELEDTGDQN